MSSVCPVVVSYRRPVLVGGISHPLEAEIGDCTPLLELGLLTTGFHDCLEEAIIKQSVQVFNCSTIVINIQQVNVGVQENIGFLIFGVKVTQKIIKTVIKDSQ